MRIVTAAVGLLLAFVVPEARFSRDAFGQTAGTVNLVGPSTSPGAPQVTPAAINAAINAALAAKTDAMVTATGGSGPRTAAAWFGDAVNIAPGAKQDGITDDAASINATIAAAAAAGKAVVVYGNGNNIVIGSPIVLVANTHLICIGNPVFFLKAGANSAVLESAGFETNIGPGTLTAGDHDISVEGCVIDGNAGNQSASVTPDFQNGIAIYGTFPRLRDVVIRNVYGHGLRLGGQIIAPPALTGYEPVVTGLHVNNTGRSGIWYQGPSDGHWSDVIVVDAGQQTDSTYCGFRIDATSRIFNFHGWHTAGASNRVSYQACVYSGGVDMFASHFEGGRQQLLLAGIASRIIGSEVYAGYGPLASAMIDVTTNLNQIIGTSISGLLNSNAGYAVKFAGGASGNQLIGNYYTGFATYSPFNFASDGGLNVIRDQGYMTPGGATAFGGTPLVTDTIDYDQGGTEIHVHTQPLWSRPPAAIAAATYTVAVQDGSLILNPSTGQTLTLPAASSYPGRILWLRLITAFAVASASANVVPVGSATPGTPILPATAGKWVLLQSDGTAWQTMAGN